MGPLGYSDESTDDGGGIYFAFYDAHWNLQSEWTTYDYDSSKTKLSDKWKVDWESTTTENKKYKVDVYSVWFYEDTWGDTADYRFEYSKIEVISKVTEKSGYYYVPFTPQEWYEENKSILKYYGNIPKSELIDLYYVPAAAYSKTNAPHVYFTSTTQSGTKFVIESSGDDERDIELLQHKIINDELKNMEGKAVPYRNLNGDENAKESSYNEDTQGTGQFDDKINEIIEAGNSLKNIYGGLVDYPLTDEEIFHSETTALILELSEDDPRYESFIQADIYMTRFGNELGVAAASSVIIRGTPSQTGEGTGKASLPNAENLKMSQTVQNHMNDIINKGPNASQLSRPYIDSNGTTLLTKEIMNGGTPVKDASLANGLRWDVQGTFRGSTGTWELVVDLDTNTVVHFNFVTK